MSDYSNNIIYSAVVGSTAYGLAVEGSDIDRRGVYLAPTLDFWSLTKPPEQIEVPGDGHNHQYWEAEKFIRLALQGNPTVLEVLWADEWRTPDWTFDPRASIQQAQPGWWLRQRRDIFMGQHIMAPYIGYATDQMHRFKKRYERTGEGDWKHLCHCVRILLQGKYALLTGQIQLMPPAGWQTILRNIRAGAIPFDDVQMWTTRLLVEIEETGTHLPPKPDYDAANRLLADLREAAL